MKKIFLLILTFCIPSILFSQGFDRGKFIFFFGGSQGIGNNTGSIEKGLENYNIPLNPTFTSLETLTSEGVFTNYFLNKDIMSTTTNLKSQSGEAGFEYGIFRYLGVGLSVSSQTIRSSRTVTVNRQVLQLYPLLLGSSENLITNLRLGSTLDFLTQAPGNIFQSATADLSLFFHLNPNSAFDPYIRIGGGQGTELLFGGRVNRVFGGLGFRYHIHERFFISSEIEHGNTYIVNYNPPSSGYRNKGNYEETSIRLGAGLSFQVGEGTTNVKPPSVLDAVAVKEIPEELKPERVAEQPSPNKFSFLASDIFDLPELYIHLEGRATVDAIARKLKNEYIGYELIITTTTTPFKAKEDGWYDNLELGLDRTKAISKLLQEKGVDSKLIIETTKGSKNYKLDSTERVIFEFKKKN